MFVIGIIEMASLVGKTGKLKVETFSIPVVISDIRKVWQRVDVLVSPVNGTGEQWVSLDRVAMETNKKELDAVV